MVSTRTAAAGVTTVLLLSACSGRTAPSPLAACGIVPANAKSISGRPSATLNLRMPSTARSGSRLEGTVLVRPQPGAEPFSSSLPVDVLIVKDQSVVGRSLNPVAGVGVGEVAPYGRPLTFPAVALLAGCTTSTAPHDGDPDASRPNLPPGDYQLIAVMDPSRVSLPVTVHVTS
jgi:hypothetical protein